MPKETVAEITERASRKTPEEMIAQIQAFAGELNGIQVHAIELNNFLAGMNLSLRETIIVVARWVAASVVSQCAIPRGGEEESLATIDVAHKFVGLVGMKGLELQEKYGEAQ